MVSEAEPINAPIHIRELDKLRIAVVIDNHCFTDQNDLPVVEGLISKPTVPIHTEHGLSFVVETTIGQPWDTPSYLGRLDVKQRGFHLLDSTMEVIRKTLTISGL